MKLFVVAFLSVVVAFGVIDAQGGGAVINNINEPDAQGGGAVINNINEPVVGVGGKSEGGAKFPVNSSSLQRIAILRNVFVKGCKQNQPDLIGEVLVALGSLLKGLLSGGQCDEKSTGLISKILEAVGNIQQLLPSGGLSGCGSLLKRLSCLLSRLSKSLESSSSQNSSGSVIGILADLLIAVFNLNSASKNGNQGLIGTFLDDIVGLLKSLLGTSEGSSCGGIIEKLLSIVDGLSGRDWSNIDSHELFDGHILNVGDLFNGLLGTCSDDSRPGLLGGLLGDLLGGVGYLLKILLGVLL